MKDILVVEDGKVERERLSKLFTAAGYSVRLCESAAEAERLVELEAFRLAIVDIGLNDKSGSYLFNSLKRSGKVSSIVIFTGNPSVHLKQRFLEEGALDYIVKASPQAQNDALINRVREILGAASEAAANGIELEGFLASYVDEKSRKLFLDSDNTFPRCKKCGARKYQVIFSHQPQLPPEIVGRVACAGCGTMMDSDVG